MLTFEALDHLYLHEKAIEKDVIELLEGILIKTGLYISMIWLDTRSNYYPLFNQMKKPGLLEKLNSNVPAHIICEGINLNEEQQKELSSSPFFICSADLT